jgi:hypothetical protein
MSRNANASGLKETGLGRSESAVGFGGSAVIGRAQFMRGGMSRNQQPFSGRLIFDHFPKTAGQAINAWLAETLGNATVTTNLICTHQEALRLGGKYPIISGHILFGEEDGLDPRYEYATLLRDPIDRVISWLHFVRNAPRDGQPELHDACTVYLESEGEILPPQLESHLPNLAVAHYAPIVGTHGADDQERVARAFRAIQSYNCVGLYERLEDFIAHLATLIGIPVPETLAKVNVTGARPKLDMISKKLRRNIAEITELDNRLYQLVTELVDTRAATKPSRPPTRSKWARYDRPRQEQQINSSLVLHSISPRHSGPLFPGSILEFELNFELLEPSRRLRAQLEIADNRGLCAFAIDNLQLGCEFSELPCGLYRIVHLLLADLPVGQYEITFSFSEIGEASEKHLCEDRNAFPIDILRPPWRRGIGYAACDARMYLQQGLK